MACNFPSLIWPDWLRTRRFSEPTFGPPRATNHVKSTVNRDFPTFSRTCIFFLLTLSHLCSSHFLASPLWLFPPLVFHLPILSEVWLLNFLRLKMFSYHLYCSKVKTDWNCWFYMDVSVAWKSTRLWINGSRWTVPHTSHTTLKGAQQRWRTNRWGVLKSGASPSHHRFQRHEYVPQKLLGVDGKS